MFFQGGNIMQITGGCFCREIKYEADIDPEMVAICHCTDCQINSGTAYGVVISIIDQNFCLIKGQLSFFQKIADSGARRDLAFCSACGTRIFSKPGDGSEGLFALRLGTVAQRENFTPKRQIFSKSALSWVSDLTSIPKV
jgi:hypothetical protein